EGRRVQARAQLDGLREELARRIARRVVEDGTVEVAPGLLFYRFSAPAGPAYAVSTLRFCVIAQGSKEVVLGTERYRYDGARYLLVSAGHRHSDTVPYRGRLPCFPE